MTKITSLSNSYVTEGSVLIDRSFACYSTLVFLSVIHDVIDFFNNSQHFENDKVPRDNHIQYLHQIAE